MLSYDFLVSSLRTEGQVKEDSYLNAPLYYILTGRKGAWIYKGFKSALIVCVHPQVANKFLVFPELGKADYELTASVLAKLTPPENGIQLARHTEEELINLKHQLAKLSYTPVSGIEIREERNMDWRYPVRILDTEIVSAMEGIRFDRLRNKFRAAARDIQVVELTRENALREMRAALKFWEGTMISRDREVEGMSEMYHALFEVLKTCPQGIQGLFFYQGKRPVGFSVWDEPYMKTANLFVNLADTTIRGLADFQIVNACRKLHGNDIKYMNLGGSEVESLDAFKTKFTPVKSVRILSADVVYRQPANDGIETAVIIAPSP